MPDRNLATTVQPSPGANPTQDADTVVQRHGGPLAVTPRPAGLLTVATRIGEYETQKKLGEGGMGVVYQGWDSQLRRTVAIKVLLPKYSAEREARERFLREARAAASVTHDNVVTIYHVGDHHGSAYLVMPLLKGQSLETYLNRKGLPTVAQTVRIAREIAAGLTAAHKQGLIHRDVKPANVWLEAPNGRVKILDFGIAKPVGSAHHTAVTDDGVVMGTPAFMSPEQARGHTLDPRSDLYSLGALLYRMCTGQPPFVRPTVMDTLTALVSEDPPPVESLNATIPPRLAGLIHRLLHRTPAERPANGDEVVKELRTIERELSGEAAPTGVIGANAAVRISAGTLPVVVPLTEEFGFEVVEDEPVVTAPRDRVHTTRRRRKKSKAAGGPSIILGLTALVVGIAVAAFVILEIVRTVGKTKEKAAAAAAAAANAAPVQAPVANPAPAVVPEVKAPEEKPAPKEEPEQPPPRFDPEGRPFPPPRFDPEGRPLPPRPLFPPRRFPPPDRE